MSPIENINTFSSFVQDALPEEYVLYNTSRIKVQQHLNRMQHKQQQIHELSLDFERFKNQYIDAMAASKLGK